MKKLLTHLLFFPCLLQIYLLGAVDQSSIPSREIPTYGKEIKEYYLDQRWRLVDHEKKMIYLGLDNQTIVGYEELVDEPLIALRAKTTPIHEKYNFADSCKNFSQLNIFPKDYDCCIPKSMENAPIACLEEILSCKDNGEKNCSCCRLPCVQLLDPCSYFDYCVPYFLLKCSEMPEKIWWEISFDKNFEIIPSNLQQIQSYDDIITLDPFADSFFNPEQSYYFRIRSMQNDKWSLWSPTHEFTVKKPKQINEPEFKKVGHKRYEISWKNSATEGAKYRVFGSNAFDFVPSIYDDRLFNQINDAEQSVEIVNNLICSTDETSIKVGTAYAFYYVIAEKNGQYSVPSPIIRIYDDGISIPRTVLQGNDAERVLFPPAYSEEQLALLEEFNTKESLHHLQQDYYAYNPHVPANVWNLLKPVFLPENHPLKPKLDRLFSKRVTRDESSMRKAGFIDPKPKKYSETVVTQHKDIKGYFFKLFLDNQEEVHDSWEALSNRVMGSLYIQDALDRYDVNHLFCVPKKWMYPLSAEPSPPPSMVRKNFVVVETAIDIFTGKENNQMWKSPLINPVSLSWLFRIMQELGLNDSPYAFNLPVTKDSKIAFIDTEHHHKWPVPYRNLWQFLSPSMQTFWLDLITCVGQ